MTLCHVGYAVLSVGLVVLGDAFLPCKVLVGQKAE